MVSSSTSARRVRRAAGDQCPSDHDVDTYRRNRDDLASFVSLGEGTGHARTQLAALVICGGAAASATVVAEQSDPGRQVLLADDGFATNTCKWTSPLAD
jgi:hypothetical protein